MKLNIPNLLTAATSDNKVDKKIKVVIANPLRLFREGLKALLESHIDLQVVGDADDGRQALKLVKDKQADLLFVDVYLHGLNGVDTTRQIVTEHKYCKPVVLTSQARRETIAEMLKAGVRGYISTDCSVEELIYALNAVMANSIYLSPRVANLIVEDYLDLLRGSDEESSSGLLTLREREVLQLLAEGNSTRQTAGILHISEKTVHTHRQKIMEKLALGSVAELTKYAIQTGIIPLD